jgi:hypothetical protein
MTTRVFYCRDCGHHMRFSGSVCHNCWTDKPVLHRPSTVILGGMATTAALVAGALSVALSAI